MPTVYDVAVQILDKLGDVSHMKLQKLVYYSQAWSLVWDDKPLFDEPIQAWANGPVVPSLFAKLRGSFLVNKDMLATGSSDALSDEAKETIDKVLKFYGNKDSQWLSDLTHMEAPWVAARVGMAPGERGNAEISLASMAEYYGSL